MIGVSLETPTNGWVKVKIDVSRRPEMKSAFIEYVMTTIGTSLWQRAKKIRDYSILVVKCLAVLKAILISSQKDIQRIIIQIDSTLVFNSINGRIYAPKAL